MDVNLKIYAGSFKGGFMVVKDLYAEAGARYTGLYVAYKLVEQRVRRSATKQAPAR